jgi:hypothetical protein
VSPPYPGLKEEALLSACFMVVSFLAYFPTLTAEKTCFSETTVEFQRATEGYISQDETLHNCRSESQDFFISAIFQLRDFSAYKDNTFLLTYFSFP